ncbi:hypothetical protein CPB86DRAFT_353197 [Serendipita vermifera]|nr:hypothetical protein CPB86DRAFT_353197 [Serendipita vermifera]
MRHLPLHHHHDITNLPQPQQGSPAHHSDMNAPSSFSSGPGKVVPLIGISHMFESLSTTNRRTHRHSNLNCTIVCSTISTLFSNTIIRSSMSEDNSYAWSRRTLSKFSDLRESQSTTRNCSMHYPPHTARLNCEQLL